MRISVIIPVYNGQATITKTLNALMAQTHTGPLEVIVVDDGSTDNTPTLVQNFSQVKYLRQDNAGPAAARNAGAKVAQGEILLFTDADCVPLKDWVVRITEGFTYDTIAAVCGSYDIANPESILARGIHAEIIYRHRVLVPDFPKVFGSYNFGVRRKVFADVGGFDATYRQASGEDNDLSYRIVKAGHQIFFARKALVAHHHTTDLVKYLREQARHGFWRARMYLDHPHMTKGDGYTFFKDLLEIPWAMCIVSAVVAMVFNATVFGAVSVFLIGVLLGYEMFFAMRMMREFFDRIFLTFTMFIRSFSRTYGLSTGIFFIIKKLILKKNE